MDLEFWLAATRAERVRGVTQMIAEMRWIQGDEGPAPDFRELLEVFDTERVEAVVVGLSSASGEAGLAALEEAREPLGRVGAREDLR